MPSYNCLSLVMLLAILGLPSYGQLVNLEAPIFLTDSTGNISDPDGKVFLGFDPTTFLAANPANSQGISHFDSGFTQTKLVSSPIPDKYNVSGSADARWTFSDVLLANGIDGPSLSVMITAPGFVGENGNIINYIKEGVPAGPSFSRGVGGNGSSLSFTYNSVTRTMSDFSYSDGAYVQAPWGIAPGGISFHTFINVAPNILHGLFPNSPPGSVIYGIFDEHYGLLLNEPTLTLPPFSIPMPSGNNPGVPEPSLWGVCSAFGLLHFGIARHSGRTRNR